MRVFLKTIVAGTVPAFMVARALQFDISTADGRSMNEPTSQPSTQPSSTQPVEQAIPQPDPTPPMPSVPEPIAVDGIRR